MFLSLVPTHAPDVMGGLLGHFQTFELPGFDDTDPFVPEKVISQLTGQARTINTFGASVEELLLFRSEACRVAGNDLL